MAPGLARAQILASTSTPEAYQTNDRCTLNHYVWTLGTALELGVPPELSQGRYVPAGFRP